ncbi:TPA: DNA cytosine methyltransferase [Listeria monocytogenes]|uniref:DNA cytosine methyltransferase n=1 Tax=Listeria monocytogenes TaxID=1639 RepID=UPI000BDFA9CE|nr:DNA cytosine methyltransferase [Listeria monocytogenes]EAC6665671.1 DNA cytosine methyltransferase [Listeria monocytogenes]EAD6007091.1 DNA cytosine methyltransferase [Listeria monocytogenes]EAD6156733.1 DNA cytosine methyltransferase [Listeria monocytogenes]EAD6171499.1 DNA cytosine methyltransferase [Listeria monocytogenes]EAD6192963.1 DNA cytosine methyltransferase [Listeria monocytogenes]
MNFLDLFAGIGGFRLGMERAGHKCVGYVEIDKYARKSYQAIHDTEGEWTREDITKVTDDEWRTLRGTIDVICGGFPCQSFSIAGKRRGFEDIRGTLFFDIARATKQIKPRILFLENVKGLLSHNKGQTFATILRTLHELGYDAEWQVCNSKNHGVPQNRERVFIVGHLRGTCGRKIFPFGGNDTAVTQNDIKVMNDPKKVRDQLEYDSINRFYDVSGIAPTLDTMQGGNREPKIAVLGNINPSKKGMNGEVYSSEGLAPTLTTNKGEGTKIAIPVLTPDRPEKRQNGRRFKEDGEEMFTLTAQDKHGVAIIQKPRGYNKGGIHEISPTVSANSWQENNLLQEGGFRIRKLTPRECWRLQGFPDWAFDRATEVNSNSQLYKQAGNSVTVNVIENIAKLFKEEQA